MIEAIQFEPTTREEKTLKVVLEYVRTRLGLATLPLEIVKKRSCKGAIDDLMISVKSKPLSLEYIGIMKHIISEITIDIDLYQYPSQTTARVHYSYKHHSEGTNGCNLKWSLSCANGILTEVE